MMQDAEDFEVQALRRLLRSGPRTNRARPTELADPPAPDVPADDHVQKTHRLRNLLQTHEGLDEAEAMMRKELQQREADFGFGHPHTLITASCLAMTLQAKGGDNVDESLHLHQRVVEGYEMHDQYGPKHTDTLNAINNLAVMLKGLRRYEKALPLYERVLAGDEEKHGVDHPHTLDSVYNLARLYDATGELDKAVPLFKRELAGCTSHYGLEHSETKTSAANLVNVLMKAGDTAGAEALIKEHGLVKVDEAQPAETAAAAVPPAVEVS